MKLVFARDEIGFSLAHVECDTLAEVEEFETWFNNRASVPAAQEELALGSKE